MALKEVPQGQLHKGQGRSLWPERGLWWQYGTSRELWRKQLQVSEPCCSLQQISEPGCSFLQASKSKASQEKIEFVWLSVDKD